MIRFMAMAFAATLVTATISMAALCGDVNGDGKVDIGDALLIAQYASGERACGVGMFSEPGSCDVNQDGQCDMLDANLIALCDAGAGSCDFQCRPFRCLRGQRRLGLRR